MSPSGVRCRATRLNVFIVLAALAAVAAFGAPAFAQEKTALAPPFHLEALVDFPDDTLASPVVITPADVDAMSAAGR